MDDKIENYKIHRRDLCDVWQQFSGREYVEPDEYSLVLLNEKRTADMNLQKAQDRMRSDIEVLLRAGFAWMKEMRAKRD